MVRAFKLRWILLSHKVLMYILNGKNNSFRIPNSKVSFAFWYSDKF